MSIQHTKEALVRVAGPLWRRLLLLGAVGAAAALGGVLAVAAWGARAGLVRAPVWVPAAWGLGVLAAAVALGVAIRAGRGLSIPRLAARLEGEPGWRAGSLRALLEPSSAGTSDELRRAADSAAAARVEAGAAESLGRERQRLSRLLRASSGILAGAVLLLAVAGVGHGPAALLWQPGLALAMVASPLRVMASHRVVQAGDSVALSISAPGRAEVMLWTRHPGTSWSPVPVALDSAGRAVRVAGPLSEALYAHVTAGRRSSDTVEVTVQRPAFVATLTLTIRYPAYLRLEDEPAAAGGDTLLLPEGSRIEAKGEVTVPLSGAWWERAGLVAGLAVDAGRFSGTLAPLVSGGYRLVLRTAGDAPIAGEEIVLPIRVLPDQAPGVDIPVPGGDTIAPLVGSLALVIDARDDHGLIEVSLERRVTHAGRGRRLPDESLPLPGPRPDRVILPGSLDAQALGLVPGDTLYVLARARDNHPAGQVGRSKEIAITVPTRPELRLAERDAAARVQAQLDSLVSESKAAQRQTEDLGRAQQRGNENALDFEAAKKAEAVADRQEELLAQAEAVAKALEELAKSAARAGLNDSAFQQALKEVQAQLDQAMSPELRRQLAELRESLKSLDRERTKEAVRKLGDQQQKLREALERSRELFRRAALEGQLASLEQESKELVEEQRQWNEQVASEDSANAAGKERALAQRADSVAAGLQRAAGQLDSTARREGMEQAAAQAKEAAQQMRQAASEAEKRQKPQAQRSGQRAQAKMQSAQEEVQQQREGQQEEWREEVVAQLDRALLETARLAEKQLAVTEQFRRSGSGADARNTQGALEEGVQKLFEQVAAATGKNALVSPQILAALAEARQQMQRAREAAASASSNFREPADRAGDAVDALNVAAYGLLRSRDDVSGSGSGSGFAEAMERMTKLANQQGQLSQDANGLLPMMGGSGVQQQLQALAARQRAMAQELERMRAQGQADAKPLGDEAGDIARALERGRLDREMIARQERLFRRMLDAGRTLNGREEDERKERESETAKPGEIRLPATLRAQLLGRDGEIRLPTWEQLRRLSPEERRLVTEYFRRLTGGVR